MSDNHLKLFDPMFRVLALKTWRVLHMCGHVSMHDVYSYACMPVDPRVDSDYVYESLFALFESGLLQKCITTA